MCLIVCVCITNQKYMKCVESLHTLCSIFTLKTSINISIFKKEINLTNASDFLFTIITCILYYYVSLFIAVTNELTFCLFQYNRGFRNKV